MIYEKMTAADVDRIARLYMDYYNQHEDGCWTHEKACRRIRQIVTVEDSLCLIQQDAAENTTGFAIGYLKPYDDLTSYWLEEIRTRDSPAVPPRDRAACPRPRRKAHRTRQRKRRTPHALLHHLRHVPRLKPEDHGEAAVNVKLIYSKKP